MVKSPLSGWIGGKYRLSKQIISMIPEHHCYCEPFAGAAWVLFRKPQSPVEVVNDINKDIVTLYRVLQNHLEEFLRWLKWVLVSRDEFNRWLETKPDTLTDIQRAARFYYIQKNSFAGRISGTPAFGYATTNRPRLNLTRIEEDLSMAHLRLAQVYVENLPYADLVTRYDRSNTFFYLDPPYWNCEDYYGDGFFCKEDFSSLVDLLSIIKGKFLLSLNDTPEVRDLFRNFKIEATEVRYSVRPNSGSPKSKEVLIRNY